MTITYQMNDNFEMDVLCNGKKIGKIDKDEYYWFRSPQFFGQGKNMILSKDLATSKRELEVNLQNIAEFAKLLS
jgi:hypothetical protein